MLFENLLDLKCDKDNGIIDRDELVKLFPNTPGDVITQLYSDHGRNEYFQVQYKNIDLQKIKWELKQVKAIELVKCSYYEEYQNWFEGRTHKLDNFNKKNWDCIDTRQEVVKYWRENNTWLRKPIFINASLIKKDNKFHLVEGHTRVGILKGAVQNGILDIESTHEIWYGNYK
jgi:hypothetical protein